MKVDLRDKIKKERKMKELPDNHRINFEQLLQKELHYKPKRNYAFLKVAASILIIISLSIAGNQFFNSEGSQSIVTSTDKPAKKINSMADISPDLKKVEDYYITQINYQLAKITITDENRDLFEVYLSQLSELQKEYKILNTQLNINDINEDIIDGLIENLQLRLHLMKQLKKKLEIIETKKDEKNESKQV